MTSLLQRICIIVVMKSGRQRDLYLRALVALSVAPPGGVTLRECAHALDAYDSSVRQALMRLAGDGIASTTGSRYTIKPSRRSDVELERAQFALSPTDIVRIATRTSPAVELAAFDPQHRTLHLVISPAADPSAVVRLREAIGRVADLTTREYSPAELGGTTVEDIERRKSLRAALARAELLRGGLDKTLPLREQRERPARPLGRLHPSLPAPSRREKQRLARTYGLDEISVFGSATRADFRQDSDIDALVHFRGGAVPTLGSYALLVQDLGQVMGRPVDVVDASSVEGAFISGIERDRVTLYGRPHALVPRAGPAVRVAGDRGADALGRRLGRRSGRARGAHASGGSGR